MVGVAGNVARYRVHVRGAVQGVGFRPYVYRLARSLGLAGWVRNDSSGVVIEIEGPREHCDGFVARLAPEAPPVADIAEVRHEPLGPEGDTAFVIVKSERLPDALAEIPPDMGICDDCRRELLDPADRRFRYPFINCTNCGPRFTIAESLPYDRPFTSMKRFTMCADCQREYDDPADRRFHAQPNACWVCGPQLALLDPTGKPIETDDPIGAVAQALREGKIAAVKGLGGFHLACDATNQAAVHTLRERKWREKKPFAVMVPDLEAALRLCELTEAEARLLASWRRPIVLARKRAGHPLAEAVAPASQFFGVMLPYTPVHVLLLCRRGVSAQRPDSRDGDVSPTSEGFAALVMTSANRTDEPIAIDNAEALERLGSVADLFLVHDRDIIRRSDDSVARVFRAEPMVQRRARGDVPRAIPVGVEGPVLALGGDLKNTICLIRKGRAYLSQHIGDLDHADALAFFEETIAHFQGILETRPALVAHDLHPAYHSTAYARRLSGVALVGVQHHHAHAVSVMAEHGLEGPVLAVSLDGTGYGIDGKVWGGEFLIATLADFERLAHLAYVPMPGGERTIKEPWRMTLAYLATQATAAIAPQARPLCHQELERAGVPPAELAAVQELLDKGIAFPETSSMGRLFDGVSALLGICTRVSYEGQAAIELEAAAEAPDGVYYPFSLDVTNVPWTISPREILRSVLDDVRRGTPRGLIAARFHSTILEVVRAVCGVARRQRGLRTVALSGGCFQNLRLLEGAVAALERDGFDVRYHRLVPTNDGGLSLGQAVAALARTRDA